MNYYILGLTGLSLDILGVIGLFFLRDKGLGQIAPITLSNPLQGLDIGPGFMNNIDGRINQSVNDLNKIIVHTNDVNKKILRRSLKWLFLIIVGFVLQFSSTWLQFQEHLHQANYPQPHIEIVPIKHK